DALACLDELKEMMKSDRVIPLQLLQQRTWLLHWSLFVFFNYKEGDKDGTELLIDMFLDKDYLNAIQTLAPHLLRYLAVCVIMNRSRKKRNFSDLIRVIQTGFEALAMKPIRVGKSALFKSVSVRYVRKLQRVHECVTVYSICACVCSGLSGMGSIAESLHLPRSDHTEFLECLYIQFDFDGAQDKLRALAQMLLSTISSCATDWTSSWSPPGTSSSRHSAGSTSQHDQHDMLAQKLNMNPEDAEKWLVDLIRNARLDAKIDSKHGLSNYGLSSTSRPISRVLYQRTNKPICCIASRRSSACAETPGTGLFTTERLAIGLVSLCGFLH
uniref:PCI domain-containing protein n=1 Tax=Macrostomum lignano TaxID=282301 RepID=A0A1I8F3G3_9PLAT